MMMRAQFTTRERCLSCDSAALRTLSTGRFDEDPLRSYIAKDPWGESPAPFLEGLSWEYVRCSDCNMSFHLKVLSGEWEERKWSNWVSAEAIAEWERLNIKVDARRERGLHFTRHAIQIEKLTRFRNGGPPRILDFGCGDGAFIDQCALYGFEAVGVDRAAARQEKNRTPIYADLAEVREQFHCVTLFEVLEHLASPMTILRELKERVLPGGILVIEVPDTSGVTGISSFHDYTMINPLDHINGFTPKTLTEFAARAGFRAISAPITHASADFASIIKQELKRVLPFAVPSKTQQYFVKGK